MKRTHRSEKGQALVLIAFGIIALIGMTGLAIDGGSAYSDHRHAQNAADTAALAAALAYTRGNDWNTIGLTQATENGYSNDSLHTVNVYHPPVSGTYANNNDYVQVVIVSTINTYFAQIIGIPTMTNTVNSVAHVTPGSSSPMFPGQAIVALDPNGCKAITFQGNANMTLQSASGGAAPGLFDNSNCSNSAFFNNSGAGSLSAGSLCSVGGVTYNPGAVNIPSIQTNCASVPYPDSNYELPNPTCSGSTSTYTGSETPTPKTHMRPGNYTGSFPPNGVDVLDSGIYCINGDFKLVGGQNVSGSGVLFYMVSGNLDWAGSSTFDFTAPGSGPYANLLIYAPASNSSTVKINGNSSSTYSGTILAPAATITINGTSDNTVNGQVIGYDVSLSGTGNTTINYDAGSSYVAPTPPNIQLAQ
jgi:Flp pilus assembly protein TadG